MKHIILLSLMVSAASAMAGFLRYEQMNALADHIVRLYSKEMQVYDPYVPTAPFTVNKMPMLKPVNIESLNYHSYFHRKNNVELVEMGKGQHLLILDLEMSFVHLYFFTKEYATVQHYSGAVFDIGLKLALKYDAERNYVTAKEFSVSINGEVVVRPLQTGWQYNQSALLQQNIYSRPLLGEKVKEATTDVLYFIGRKVVRTMVGSHNDFLTKTIQKIIAVSVQRAQIE